MTQIQLVKVASNALAPANAEASAFLQRLKPGAWLNCDVKQARNYLFHKRFFALLGVGFEYWTPAGGTITPAEKQYLSGYIRYLISIVGNNETLIETEQVYALRVADRRADGHAIVKSFEAFRKWATIESGFYDEYVLPDNTRRREAKSISFANMDESEFHEVYKAVFNVLWNHVLFRAFPSQQEAEAVAMQLLEMAA